MFKDLFLKWKLLSGHLNVLDIQSSFHSAANDSDIDKQVAAWLLSELEKRNNQNLFELFQGLYFFLTAYSHGAKEEREECFYSWPRAKGGKG